MSSDDNEDKSSLNKNALNRRNMLLGGTTLAAATAIVTSAPIAVSQAQAQQPAPSGGKPNILVIWGDDVGVANISAYSNGLMGYETPNVTASAARASNSCTITASSRAPPVARRS
jgi:hypothetical protein